MTNATAPAAEFAESVVVYATAKSGVYIELLTDTGRPVFVPMSKDQVRALSEDLLAALAHYEAKEVLACANEPLA